MVVSIGHLNPEVEYMDDKIYQVAYKRSFCVILGVLVALIVSRTIWPYLARREMRIGKFTFFFSIWSVHIIIELASIVEDLSELYSVVFVSLMGKRGEELGRLAMKRSIKIQIRLRKAEELLEVAKLEPRLKVLSELQNIHFI
jgi:hypothetical protein